MFVQRILLFNNSDRVSEAVIANPTWYTSITNNKFPYGIKNSPIDISSDHIKWFMSNKTSLLIGNNDINLKSVNSSKGAQRQGITRFDRANSYFNSLINISDSNNIPFRWSYKVVDKADHDYLKMTPVAAKILLEDVSSFD